MRLSKNIESSVKGGFVYGIEGEEVKVIRDDGTVSIVENASGFRYPVRTEFLTMDLIEVNPPQKVIEKPIIKTVSAKGKKSQPIPPNQQNLFK